MDYANVNIPASDRTNNVFPWQCVRGSSESRFVNTTVYLGGSLQYGLLGSSYFQNEFNGLVAAPAITVYNAIAPISVQVKNFADLTTDVAGLVTNGTAAILMDYYVNLRLYVSNSNDSQPAFNGNFAISVNNGAPAGDHILAAFAVPANGNEIVLNYNFKSTQQWPNTQTLQLKFSSTVAARDIKVKGVWTVSSV